MSLGEGGVDGDGLLVVADGAVVIALIVKRAAEVAVAVRVVRVDLEGFLETANGRVVILDGGAGVAEVIVGSNAVRPQREGGAETAGALGRVLDELAQLEIQPVLLRVMHQRAAQKRHPVRRLLDVAGPPEYRPPAGLQRGPPPPPPHPRLVP